MPRAAGLALMSLALPAIVLAQAAGTIQAQGSATVFANPDQAQFNVAAVTDGSTAQAAAQANAASTSAVLSALKQALGTSGNIQTIGYSVVPRYAQGQSTTIVGYTVTNTLQVTTSNLSQVGSLIDTANQAGANSVTGLTFSLMNPDPLKQQALTQAAKQALAHAAAIASGLGAKTGAVVSAQEGASLTPIVAASLNAPPSTPIQTGQVSVTANVTIAVQLGQ